MKQTQKLLEHNRFERKIQQLTFPMDMEITIPQDDPVRLASAQMHLLATLNKGRASICTITLPRDTLLQGITLKDLTLPNGSLIISIVRGDKMIIPNGLTAFQAEDEIVAVCEGKSQKELMKVLRANESE